MLESEIMIEYSAENYHEDSICRKKAKILLF